MIICTDAEGNEHSVTWEFVYTACPNVRIQNCKTDRGAYLAAITLCDLLYPKNLITKPSIPDKPPIILVSGTALTSYSYFNFFIPTGFIYLNGTASIRNGFYTYTGNGTTVLAGTASVTSGFYRYTVSGGCTLSGTALTRKAYYLRYTVSGGLTTGGSCTTKRTSIYKYLGIGAIATGGTGIGLLKSSAYRYTANTQEIQISGGIVITDPTLKANISWPDDFQYLGCFRLPHEVNGQETAYSLCSLGIGPGENGLIGVTCGSRNFSNPLYIFNVPDSLSPGPNRTGPLPGRTFQELIDSDPGADWSGVPMATIERYFTYSTYEGLRVTPSGSIPGNLPDVSHGVSWWPDLQKIYVSFGNLYPAGGNQNIYPCLMAVDIIDEDTTEAKGPWVSEINDPNRISSQQIRGTSFKVPDWFADQFGGKVLGLGAGGYYSIIVTGSNGPSLAITTHPSDSNSEMETLTLLSYTHLGPKRAIRPNNSSLGPIATSEELQEWIDNGGDPAVWVDSNGNAGVSWDSPTQDPAAGPGYWMASDSIEGAATWVDGISKSGPIWFANLGLGTVLYRRASPYIYNEVSADGYDTYVYTVDHQDLKKVGLGEIAPYDPIPSYARFEPPFFYQRVSGASWHDGKLYVLCHWCDGNRFSSYPVVAVYSLIE